MLSCTVSCVKKDDTPDVANTSDILLHLLNATANPPGNLLGIAASVPYVLFSLLLFISKWYSLPLCVVWFIVVLALTAQICAFIIWKVFDIHDVDLHNRRKNELGSMEF